jgi:hypothetical protein
VEKQDGGKEAAPASHSSAFHSSKVRVAGSKAAPTFILHLCVPSIGFVGELACGLISLLFHRKFSYYYLFPFEPHKRLAWQCGGLQSRLWR